MDPFVGRIEVLSDPPALARRVAEWMTATASAAEGRFRVALSGGSTPRALYSLLASEEFRDRFPIWWPGRQVRVWPPGLARGLPAERLLLRSSVASRTLPGPLLPTSFILTTRLRIARTEGANSRVIQAPSQKLWNREIFRRNSGT